MCVRRSPFPDRSSISTAVRINRCYRILGLPPGASQAEIKQAYRDLVQVWHPDRFAHDARLQQKAQNNLKRINEAFEVLLSYNPPKHPSRFSQLTGSFSAVLDIGDMLQTGEYARPPQGPPSFRVLGLEEIERTREHRTRRRWRSPRRLPPAVVVAALVVAALAVVIFLMS